MRNDEDKSPGDESEPEKTIERDVTPLPQLSGDLNLFADRVGTFAARSTGLDRDALMFAAGLACRDDIPVPVSNESIQLAGGDVRGQGATCGRAVRRDRETRAEPFETRTECGNDSQQLVRRWQRATAAMTLIATCLSVALILRTNSEPRLIVVERERPPASIESDHLPAKPHRDATETTVPSSRFNASDETSPPDDDRQLAEAWSSRQMMIAHGGMNDSRLAMAPSDPQTNGSGDNVSPSSERPFAHAISVGERSRETIQRLLEEQL